MWIEKIPMRSTKEWLDQVKERYGCKSDAELSRLIGVTKAAISLQRNGKHEMGVKEAIRVAQLLGIDPMRVIAGTQFHQDDDYQFWAGLYGEDVMSGDSTESGRE